MSRPGRSRRSPELSGRAHNRALCQKESGAGIGLDISPPLGYNIPKYPKCHEEDPPAPFARPQRARATG